MKVWRWILCWRPRALPGCRAGRCRRRPRRPEDTKIAPRFKVDPSWPKPLPDNWVIGQIGGIAVDSRDHVWVLQRPRSVPERYLGPMLSPPRSTCCFAAPSVLEFDSRWRGGPGVGRPLGSRLYGIALHARDGMRVAGDRARHLRLGGRSRLRRRQRRTGPPGDQVHRRRHVRDADRHGRDAGQQSPGAVCAKQDTASRPSGRDGSGPRRPTSSTSPMATRTGASSSSTRPQGNTSATGAPTANVPNDADPGPYDPNAPLRPAVPHACSLCGSGE